MSGVLLFGGSFDPVHHGHLIVCRAAAEALGIERIILIPSAIPPHKQHVRLASAEDRLAMCLAAVGDDAQFEVSDWELRQSGPSYTLLTVRHFREVLGEDTQVHWLIGSDSLAELHTWYQVRELLDACRVVTASRSGSTQPDLSKLAPLISSDQRRELEQSVVETPLIDISATQVRDRVRAGQSIRYFVSDAVRQLIEQRGLYCRE